MIETQIPAQYLTVDDDHIAYTLTPKTIVSEGLNILFLSGFRSSMFGNKAQQLTDWAPHQGWTVCRFDYRGHGLSSGNFSHFTLEDWLNDAEQVMKHCFGTEPVMLIGSSMGGWLSYHLALRNPKQIRSIITIASAPDFIDRLFRQGMNDSERLALKNDGVVTLPKYSDRELTQEFFAAGSRLSLLTKDTLPIHCPVYGLHGLSDETAPWANTVEMAQKVDSDDSAVELIKGGDHRLSTPSDLQRLFMAIKKLAS